MLVELLGVEGCSNRFFSHLYIFFFSRLMVMRFDGSITKDDIKQQWDHNESSMLTERMGIVAAFSSFAQLRE